MVLTARYFHGASALPKWDQTRRRVLMTVLLNWSLDARAAEEMAWLLWWAETSDVQLRLRCAVSGGGRACTHTQGLAVLYKVCTAKVLS